MADGWYQLVLVLCEPCHGATGEPGIAGNIRMSVEYTGMGRVVSQTPKVGETLHKGQICKLTLKEKG